MAQLSALLGCSGASLSDPALYSETLLVKSLDSLLLEVNVMARRHAEMGFIDLCLSSDLANVDMYVDFGVVELESPVIKKLAGCNFKRKGNFSPALNPVNVGRHPICLLYLPISNIFDVAFQLVPIRKRVKRYFDVSF